MRNPLLLLLVGLSGVLSDGIQKDLQITPGSALLEVTPDDFDSTLAANENILIQ
jgi:hypothetical protein